MALDTQYLINMILFLLIFFYSLFLCIINKITLVDTQTAQNTHFSINLFDDL